MLSWWPEWSNPPWIPITLLMTTMCPFFLLFISGRISFINLTSPKKLVSITVFISPTDWHSMGPIRPIPALLTTRAHQAQRGVRTPEQKTVHVKRREGHGLTENVDPPVRQAVHARPDGVLVAHVQLFDLQGPAQSPTRRLHQVLAFTEVSHRGVDWNKNMSLSSKRKAANRVDITECLGRVSNLVKNSFLFLELSLITTFHIYDTTSMVLCQTLK